MKIYSKKSFVALACVAALLSATTSTVVKADDLVDPNAVVTNTTSPVPSTEAGSGNVTVDTPVVPLPSTSGGQLIPDVPSDPSDAPVDNTTPVAPTAPTTPTVPTVPTVPTTPVADTDKPNPSTDVKPSADKVADSTTNPSTDVKPSTDTKPSTDANAAAKPADTTKPSASTSDTATPSADNTDNTNLPLVDPTTAVANPIVTATGRTVVGTDNGNVIVKDTATGQEVKISPTELGGKVEKDGTVTIKAQDGKLTRLPNTGMEVSYSLLAAGAAMFASGFAVLKKKRKS